MLGSIVKQVAITCYPKKGMTCCSTWTKSHMMWRNIKHSEARCESCY